ncbi:MAG: TetR family transcriptional regulator [Streptosporangiales bacterium]|nr:TetR family transcriptional regulator [Streptosporangiales bacterium]
MTDRPLRADARRNRARVLAAAEEAFAAEGATVPLDEIARRAGVGAGTVYRHFPTKEALFEAVILHRVQDLTEHARADAAAEEAGTAFFSFLRRLAETAAAKHDVTDALTGAGFDVTSVLAKAQADMRDALGALLDRAQRAGDVRDDIAIDDLMILLKGSLLALRGSDADDAARDRVYAVLADGLRTRP